MSRIIIRLIELVAVIWWADTALRDQSVLGESGWEKRNRNILAWICGSIIVLLVIAWFVAVYLEGLHTL